MAEQMVPGYVKADSTNLPKIDMFMIIEFITSGDRFNAAWVRAAKATVSSRESYGDSDIGYVCFRRENSRCMVRGKITHEHSVRQKQYNVTLTVNEAEEKVENIECHDCAASTESCKHAIAFLMWNYRRTETPSPTEVECYWKKSTLSNVVMNEKLITTGKLVKSSQSTWESQLPDNSKFSGGVIQKAEDLSIHQLLLKFCDEGGDSADDFIEFAKRQMSDDLCKVAELNTSEQSGRLWFKLRHGRVPASKAHEAAGCRKPDGSLVRLITGATKAFNTVERKRERKLKDRVRCEVEKTTGKKIRKSGLFLLPTLPVIEGAPDGIGDDFIIVIKYPVTEEAFQKFVRNGQDKPKCKALMNVKMLAAEKKKCLFCVVDPNFERNEIISMVWLDYDDQATCRTVENVIEFWKRNIFPIMMQSIKK